MADVQHSTPALQWGRHANGRFFINIGVQVAAPNGQALTVPTSGFLLTKEEEDSLMEALTGLQIAAVLPFANGNGRH